jgi:hypothetical protein
MPSLSDMAERIRERILRLVSGINLGALGDRVKGRAAGVPAVIRDLGEKLWTLLPGELRQKLPWLEGKLIFILMGLVLAGGLAILAAGVSGGPVSKGPVSDRPAPARPPAGAGTFNPLPIPPEDLFLPEEPDFLPPVILDRGRRETWTAEDAEPFWYDPLEGGEEEWRELVERVVDDLLERVP